MNQNQQDLLKLKTMFDQVNQKHQQDLAANRVEEIEKNKRVMVLLLDKMKEKKKQIDMQNQVMSVSKNIEKDQVEQKKFFAKKSHRKGNKRVHFLTVVVAILSLIYSLICIAQPFLYKHFFEIQLNSNNLNPRAVDNLNFSAKFIGIIITLLFIIFIFNYKNMKNRIPIIIMGSFGLIGGILSWGGIGSLNSGFFSGRGGGIIPGFALLITFFWLCRNIFIYKAKKVDSLKESSEFKEIEVNLDEQKLEHYKNVEKLKKEMAQKEKKKKRKKPRPEGERAKKPRPEGERAKKSRPEGERPKKPRPEGERPKKPRPEGERPKKPRPEGERPKKPRPEGERPKKPRPEGERPKKPRPEGERSKKRQPQIKESVDSLGLR